MNSYGEITIQKNFNQKVTDRRPGNGTAMSPQLLVSCADKNYQNNIVFFSLNYVTCSTNDK